MSESELKRIKILRDVVEKRLKQTDVAKALNLGKRQVIRLVEQYRQEGEAGLMSKRRGKTSNRKKSDDIKGDMNAIFNCTN